MKVRKKYNKTTAHSTNVFSVKGKWTRGISANIKLAE